MTQENSVEKAKYVRFCADNSGVAATEFALLIPVFVLCLLAMIDVGFAVNQRMNLDRQLRSSAQLAMSGNNNIADLTNVVQNSQTNNSENYSVSVTQTCECSGVGSSCSDRCSDATPPSLFFNFSAIKTVDTILLPEFDIESTLRVQYR